MRTFVLLDKVDYSTCVQNVIVIQFCAYETGLNLSVAHVSPREILFSVNRANTSVPNSRSCGAYSRATGMSLRRRSFLAEFGTS